MFCPQDQLLLLFPESAKSNNNRKLVFVARLVSVADANTDKRRTIKTSCEKFIYLPPFLQKSFFIYQNKHFLI